MANDLQDSFEELIPGAGDKAATFLQVVRDRAAKENVGLTFAPKEIRKTKQIVLEAPIQLGGTFFKGAPMKVVVHAEAFGSSLQVGWQLTEQSAPSALMAFDSVRASQASQSLRNLKPENQRQLSGMLIAFHKVVFLPVLRMLVEATEQAAGRSQDGSGFLGA